MKLSLILLGLITAISASPAPLGARSGVPAPAADDPVPTLAPDDISITPLSVRSPAADLLSPAASSSENGVEKREKVVSRTINLSSILTIRDDEPWPVNHRDYTRSHTLPAIILGTKTGYTQKTSFKAEVGGEIRVEVHLTLTLRPSDLSVLVSYTVLLFEGTSTKTKDLDGKIEGSRRFFKNDDGHIKNTVHNTDEGGDRAAWDLRVVNAP